MDNLKIFNVKWTSTSAGPSPDSNRRTELFLAGCKKAASGNPCKGCFNQKLWSADVYNGYDSPRECFNRIRKFAPNKYITIVGGEPLDQLEPLAELCRYLHRDGYHIIVITHYLGDFLLATMNIAGNKNMKKLLSNIDCIIDGEYMEKYRIWDEERAGDGLHDVIGSGNQCIWDFHDYNAGKEMFCIHADKLEGWYLRPDNEFVYILKEGVEEDGEKTA